MFDRFSAWQPQLLSVLRIMSGALFLQHGTAKVLGFPVVEGVPPPGLSLAGLSGPLELILGVLLVLGSGGVPRGRLLRRRLLDGSWGQRLLPHPERRRAGGAVLLRLPVHLRRGSGTLEPRRGHA